jgi:carbamoyltransferase
MRHLLGISAFYHDSAAALLCDGQIVGAAQEERFSRRKNDERFPQHAIQFCLRQGGLTPADLDGVVFYDKPITKFARMLETWLAVAPRGLTAFGRVLPNWLGEKLNLRQTIRNELPGLRADCPVLFTEHHQAHAASAFYPSPFEEAAILTVDGVGEWATTTVGEGRGHTITIHEELRFPHSIGLLYSTFTAYCGFRVNSGEYKLMGLAPYGEPKFVAQIYEHLLDLKPDGSFRLNLDYFDFLHGARMANEKFHALFGGTPRPFDGPLEARHADVARSIQTVTGEVMLRLARHARDLTGMKNLCLAGGVALNCVANGGILREKIFDQLWIQPAAGDAGGALGAALAAWYAQESPPAPRLPEQPDAMRGAFLGPEFGDAEIETALRGHGAVFERLDDEMLLDRTAALLAAEKVLGWFQGRMEFGPRALGNRSILGDPRSAKMQSVMNLKVKFRESFRPFAPVVLRDRLGDYFDLDIDSPYMLLVAPVKESLRRPVECSAAGFDQIRQTRSTIPAVTHVDYSARIQTLTREQNPRLHALLKKFETATGCGLLVNTSFNVRGEPVVCTPDDAYRCFVNTEMDYLVMGGFLLDRAAQPKQMVARTFEPVPD